MLPELPPPRPSIDYTLSCLALPSLAMPPCSFAKRRLYSCRRRGPFRYFNFFSFFSSYVFFLLLTSVIKVGGPSASINNIVPLPPTHCGRRRVYRRGHRRCRRVVSFCFPTKNFYHSHRRHGRRRDRRRGRRSASI
jgi:hypothetical protein